MHFLFFVQRQKVNRVGVVELVHLEFPVDNGNIPFQSVDEYPLAVVMHGIDHVLEFVTIVGGDDIDHALVSP